MAPAYYESAYGVCLAYEVRKRGFEVEEERVIPIAYDEVKLECGFRADLVVNGQVVVELKAKREIHPVDKAPTLSHLRMMGLRFGRLNKPTKLQYQALADSNSVHHIDSKNRR